MKFRNLEMIFRKPLAAHRVDKVAQLCHMPRRVNRARLTAVSYTHLDVYKRQAAAIPIAVQYLAAAVIAVCQAVEDALRFFADRCILGGRVNVRTRCV